MVGVSRLFWFGMCSVVVVDSMIGVAWGMMVAEVDDIPLVRRRSTKMLERDHCLFLIVNSCRLECFTSTMAPSHRIL